MAEQDLKCSLELEGAAQGNSGSAAALEDLDGHLKSTYAYEDYHRISTIEIAQHTW